MRPDVAVVLTEQAQGEHAGGGGRDQPDAGGEPVEPVHEVHGVDEHHAQEHGEEHALVLAEQQLGAGAPADAAPGQVDQGPLHTHQHQQPGRGGLAGQLRQRVQAEPVVERADQDDQPAGHHHGDRLRGVVERAAQDGQLPGHEHPGEDADVDGDPAEARDGHGVDVASAGHGDRAGAEGEAAHHAGEQEGHHGRAEADQEVLPDRQPLRGERWRRAHAPEL